MVLVLPIGGKSSRFNSERPKWSLTCPNGLSMLEMSCQGLSGCKFSLCIIVSLERNKNILGGEVEIIKRIKKILKCKVVFLNIKGSKSQGETVSHAVNYMIEKKIGEPFFIKDCDSFFEVQNIKPNSICAFELDKDYSGPIANKSFITKNGLEVLVNIREKEIISNVISVGGYCFNSVYDYSYAFEKLTRSLNSEKEIYISDVISLLMIDHVFQVTMVNNFVDCGTQEMWDLFKSKFKTIFVDIDGVLISSNSKDGVKTDLLINENFNALLDLQNRLSLQIVLTTARNSIESSRIVKLLKSRGLNVYSVVHGLYHAKRILINDFTNTNKYPTAIAINFPRDNKNLNEYI